MAGSLDTEQVLAALVSASVPAIGDWSATYLPEGDGLRRVSVGHADPADASLAERLLRDLPVPIAADLPVAEVFRTGVPLLLADIDPDAITQVMSTPASLEHARAVQPRSQMTVPITNRGRVLGVLSFLSTDSERRYTADDLALALELGQRAGMAVDNATLFARQREVVEVLQRAVLLEALPEVPGLELAARYVPAATGIDVGGDWYDAFGLADGRTVLTVGDVAGHGLRTAAVMGQLRNALRAYAVESEGPADVLRRLDRLLAELEPDQMATAICLFLDPGARTVRLASAGHPPPVLVSGGQARLVDESPAGPPLGVAAQDGSPLVEQRVELVAGETLVCYTDGLIERRAEGIDVGLARLIAAAASSTGAEPEVMCDAVLAAALPPGGSSDDTCLLVARVAQ